MSAAYDFMSRQSSHDAPRPVRSDVDIAQPADVEILEMADVLSMPPQKAPPLPRRPVAAIDDEPTDALQVPAPDYAALSLEATGDDELLALLAQKRRTKRKAVGVCLAFPTVIALVLFALGSGEGRPKDAAMTVMSGASSRGDTVATNIERDRLELEAIRAELALAEKLAEQDAETQAKGTKRRGLPR